MDDNIVILASDSEPEMEHSPSKCPRPSNTDHTKRNREEKKVIEQDSLQKENTSHNIIEIPIQVQPRKTARRGLARKINSDSDQITGTSSEKLALTTTHRKASVYSKCVGHGLKSIYGTQRTEEQEKDIDDDVIISPVEDQEVSDSAVTSVSDDESSSSKSTNDEEPSPSSPVKINSIRSPTPPPEMKNAGRQHRMSKRVAKAFNTLNKAKAHLNGVIVTPSRRSRTRIVEQIPAELGDSPAAKTDMTIKVRYLSKVHRLQHGLNQPFHVLLTKLSEELGKEEHQLGLFLRDTSLSLSSSPKDVNLTVADILECYSMTGEKGESMTVVIQCSNSRKKTTMVAYKRLPLQDLMDRYAEESNLDTSSFTFSFDGDDVSPKDTLLKLEMEEGDVLDVVPKIEAHSKALAKARRPQVITLI